MIDELTRLIHKRLTDRRPFVVGITGPVSVGKTVLAGVLADTLPAGVLCTDVFLFPNAVEVVVWEWFVTRFLGFRDEGRHDPTLFYAAMADLDDEATRAIALGAWDAVNGPNLREHILPTRARADLVVEKAPDHAIRRILES